MSEFTGKKLKEARVKKGLSQDEAANLMNVAKRAISEMEAGKRSISADELAQFSRIYNVDVRELLFVEFTEAGDEQRLTAKYSSFLKLLEKLSDREVEDVYWVIKEAGKTVIAYGDGMNDYYMLKKADVGYLIPKEDGTISRSLKGKDLGGVDIVRT